MANLIVDGREVPHDVIVAEIIEGLIAGPLAAAASLPASATTGGEANADHAAADQESLSQ
jgi:hypothetical protein